MNALDDRWAALTIRDYCCSNCWGHLLKTPALDDERKWWVFCPNCGLENTAGYVTKKFAERRRSESVADQMDARQMLQDLGIVKDPHAGKTAAQLLAELGF